MDENDFEGTLVLEKLAEIGAVEAFFDAIDSDDFTKVKALMKRAHLDSETIEMVIKKISESDFTH
jgi:iron uptake system EfeUOB component EfeO/EfeM